MGGRLNILKMKNKSGAQWGKSGPGRSKHQLTVMDPTTPRVCQTTEKHRKQHAKTIQIWKHITNKLAIPPPVTSTANQASLEALVGAAGTHLPRVRLPLRPCCGVDSKDQKKVIKGVFKMFSGLRLNPKMARGVRTDPPTSPPPPRGRGALKEAWSQPKS